jgi:hypothetical protein
MFMLLSPARPSLEFISSPRSFAGVYMMMSNNAALYDCFPATLTVQKNIFQSWFVEVVKTEEEILAC